LRLQISSISSFRESPSIVWDLMAHRKSRNMFGSEILIGTTY
jgi:hypothetical protein